MEDQLFNGSWLGLQTFGHGVEFPSISCGTYKKMGDWQKERERNVPKTWVVWTIHAIQKWCSCYLEYHMPPVTIWTGLCSYLWGYGIWCYEVRQNQFSMRKQKTTCSIPNSLIKYNSYVLELSSCKGWSNNCFCNLL